MSTSSLHAVFGSSATRVQVGRGVTAAVDKDGDVRPSLAKANEIPYAITTGSDWRPALNAYDYSARQGGYMQVDDVADIGITGRHPRLMEPVYYSLSSARMSVTEGTDGILCGHLCLLSRLHERDYKGLSLNYHFVVPQQTPVPPAKHVNVWYPLPQDGAEDDVVVVVNPAGSKARVTITQPLADPAQPLVQPATVATITPDDDNETDTVFRRTKTAWEAVTGHHPLWRADMNFSILAVHQHLHDRTPRINFGGSRHIAKTTSLRSARTGFVWTINDKSPVKGVTGEGEKLVLPEVADRALGVRLETQALDGTMISRSDLQLGGSAFARLSLHQSNHYAIEVTAKRSHDNKIKLEIAEPSTSLRGDVGHDVELVVYELRASASF